MASRKSNLKDLGRSQGRGRGRSTKSHFLIVCEGRVTERDYFRHFRRVIRGSLVVLEIASDHGKDPERLVRQAIAQRSSAEVAARRMGDDSRRYDQVWCVFDVDQHARLPAARRLASDNGIMTAVSNPCFEVWALLHFRDQTAHIEGRKVTAALCEFMPGYEKQLDCAALEPHRPVAVERAKRLEHRHERNGTPDGNPSTGVWRLIETLEEEAERFRAQGSSR